MPTFDATVYGHTGNIPTIVLQVGMPIASQAAAQTILNQMKALLTNQGVTIDRVEASFNADQVALS